jgi:hypothetical protein
LKAQDGIRDALGKDVARELHGDRRKPFGEVPILDVDEECAWHTPPIDAGVREESLVFGDDEGGSHERRNIGVPDDRPTLEPDLGDEPAIAGEHLGRLTWLILLKGLDWRAASGTAHHRPAGEAKTDGRRPEKADAQQQHARETRILVAEALGEWDCRHMS